MTLDDILGVELTPLQRVFIEEAKQIQFDSVVRDRFLNASEAVTTVKWFYDDIKDLLERGEI